MSVCNFFASDAILEDVRNEKVWLLSVKEAKERGILPTQKGILSNEQLISKIDENEEGTILYFEKKEDLGEIDIFSVAEDVFYSDCINYTQKKYCSSLNWTYTEKRAEQLIVYIKKHLEKTKEIELWEIWLGEKEKPDVKCCKLSELDTKKIKNIFGTGFKKPMCLRVIRE